MKIIHKQRYRSDLSYPFNLSLLLFLVVRENRMQVYFKKMPRVSDEYGVLEVKCKRK